MIVISGALVLVALVLLLIGLFQPELGFVYASIAVSLVSFGFLIVGVLQRRREQPTAGAEPSQAAGAPGASTSTAPSAPAGGSRAAAGALPAVDLDEGITALIPAPTAAGAASAGSAGGATALADRVSGAVLVVEGRPRYHVGGCRYLAGKTVDEMDVTDARDEGFTACGVCKPDEALESASPQPEPVVARRVARVPAGAATTASQKAEAAAPDASATEEATARLADDQEPVDAETPEGGLEQTALEVPIVVQPEDERPEVLEPAKAAALTSQATAKVPPGRTPAKRASKAVPAVKATKAAKAVPASKAAKATKAAKVTSPPAADVVPTTLLEPPVAPAPGAPAKKAAAPSSRAAKRLPATAPVPTVPVKAATKAAGKASTSGVAKSPAKTQEPTKAAAKAPAKAPAKASAASGAPATKTPKGSVVVIPDRGRFHTADCRYVRRADDAQTLTRAQALRQGYEACGVCTP